MSDIYTVWNDEKEKNRFRGKMIVLDETGPKRKTKSIKEILEEMGEEKTEYEYICRRPVRLGEAVAREHIDSLNIFHDDKRSFNINGDEKRKWKKKFLSAQEALETHHESMPLRIGDWK